MTQAKPIVLWNVQPTRHGWLGLLIVLLSSLAPLSAQFTNTAESAGLNLLYPSGFPTWPGVPNESPPNFLYSGQATCAVDLNGDGWTDLIITRYLAPCLVLINQQNGTFSGDQAAAYGLDGVSDIGAVVAGDFSNSGRQDIFMVPIWGDRYYLFVNNGNGRYTERAVERGADLTSTHWKHRGQSVALVDTDLDGFLDIHVTEWGVASGSDNARHAVLLINRGTAAPGFFENRTSASGLTQPHSGNTLYGFASLWADFDEDSYPDLMLAGDFSTSQLWWNNGTGSFSNGTAAGGILTTTGDMGAAVADYDGDGRLDVFYGSILDGGGFTPRNLLYKNLGNRIFQDVATTAGVKESGWSWGAAFLDANNDGRPDLMVTNGFSTGTLDTTSFFLNQGASFTDAGAAFGVTDNQIGRSVLVFDYNNDGREDVLITNATGPRVLYRNDTPQAGNHRLRLRFTGTVSNRDGYGTVVKATAGGRTHTGLYQPTNAYLAQHEPLLHLGLGTATTVERLEIRWPSGIVQTLENVDVDQVLGVTEPVLARSAPVLTGLPLAASVEKGETITLTAAATGFPAPVFRWYRNGALVEDAFGPVLIVKNMHAIDAGNYTVTALNPVGFVSSAPVAVNVTLNVASQTVARWWNEALLDGIRTDVPNPPVHARNLYTLSAAMWDAFWAYEPGAWNHVSPAFHREIVAPSAWGADREAAQRHAISYAAFRIIMERFKKSPGKVRTELGTRWFMLQFGYDPDFTGTVGNSPAAVGNRIGYAVLAAMLNDGANEANGYADATGYTAVNAPLLTAQPGATMTDFNRWQPLDLAFSVTQNGIVLPPAPQRFVGVNARNTTPFAIVKPTAQTLPAIYDPGPQPLLGGAGDARFREEVAQVIGLSGMLDPSDGALIDVSPGAMLNNTPGTNDGTGHALNPVTGLPYAPNVVPRGDYTRILSEYWADGPSSETPPGHWNVIFNAVNDHPLSHRRWEGSGTGLPDLEWEIRGYYALNGAVHDAACAAWLIKRQYDGPRPISMIRCMATLGQSSLPGHPTYHVNGLPLIPGLIELLTPESSAPGQRHAHLAAWAGTEIAIKTWQGNPSDPRNQFGGVGWIRAKTWKPYQLETFVSPAFPGYVSGHSTFSAAAAEVLTRMTGSPFFPGGISQKAFPANTFLFFEKGPSQEVTLQWATYYDAADQAGLSRLFGGIHVAVDDFEGRKLGRLLGAAAYTKQQQMTATPVGDLPTWRQIQFNTTEDAGIAANGAAPAGDGVPNLLKYALGAAAYDSVAGLMPTAVTQADRLAFSFTRYPGKTDISYWIEASPDLSVWTPIAVSAAGGAVQNIEGRSFRIAETAGPTQQTVVTVTDGTSVPATRARFLRLKVTRP